MVFEKKPYEKILYPIAQVNKNTPQNVQNYKQLVRGFFFALCVSCALSLFRDKNIDVKSTHDI